MIGLIFDVMKTAVVDIMLGEWSSDCLSIDGIKGWLPNVPDLVGLEECISVKKLDASAQTLCGPKCEESLSTLEFGLLGKYCGEDSRVGEATGAE